MLPQLRFKDKSGNDFPSWEEKKIKDFGKIAMCKRIFKEQTSSVGEIPFYKIGTFGGEPDAYITRELFEEFKIKYSYPTKGNILVSASGSIGKLVEYKGNDEYFQDSNIIWLEHNDSILDGFLKQSYITYDWLTGLEGSTIKRLYNKNFLDMDINVPCREEQEKISNVLSIIDEKIAQQEKFNQKIKEIKLAMLVKLLPESGEDLPKIRFDGFDGKWKKTILDKVVTIGSGKDYKHLNAGEISVYGTGGYMLSVDKALSYNEDAVGIGRKGTIDNPFILKAPFWTVDTLFYVKPKENYDLYFIYDVFQTIDWRSKDESTGVPSLSKVAISSTEIMVPPTKEEQEKLGDFFRALDKKIELNQQKYEKLSEVKKALLSKLLP
jgi:type I restriction enzyme S subunit